MSTYFLLISSYLPKSNTEFGQTPISLISAQSAKLNSMFPNSNLFQSMMLKIAEINFSQCVNLAVETTLDRQLNVERLKC